MATIIESSLPSSLQHSSETRSLNLLPILIIPGFMGSGLEVTTSRTRPDWDGKQIWADLKSLGFSPKYFGASRKKEKTQADPEQQEGYKAMWLHHMQLQEDLCNETNGVKILPNTGMEGIDYMNEGSFTGHKDYSLGPLIEALERAGYNQSTVDLEAAPYDWRLPPTHLELRHGYFTKTIQLIEEMYKANKNTSVILMGYGMGAKVTHYLLNFGKLLKGQDWIDSRIHTFVPVAAPHLGAPIALRSIIAGDRMGFEKFLNDEETLGLGRSLGSIPWLFPQNLPPGVPSSAYVLDNGVLKIDFPHGFDPNPLIEDRRAIIRPKKLQMVVSCGLKSDQRNHVPLVTPFRTISDEGICKFDDVMSFSTDPKPKTPGFRLQVALQEPFLTDIKPKQSEGSFILTILKWITCYRLVEYLGKLFRWISNSEPVVLNAGEGRALALSEPIIIPKSVFKGKPAKLKVAIYHKEDLYEEENTADPRMVLLHVNVRWLPHSNDVSIGSNHSVISKVTDLSPTLNIRKSRKRFQEISGHNILHYEGLDNYMSRIHDIYDRDGQLGPRSVSANDPPPVSRVHAIYGINVPTEIGGVYHRMNSCSNPIKVMNVYAPDPKASLSHTDYRIKNGLLMETPKTKQVVAKNRRVSGDGYVPYWSLQHCKTWKSDYRQVSVVELEGAEHQKILADARFHQELLKYSRREAQALAKKRKFKSVSFKPLWPFEGAKSSETEDSSSEGSKESKTNVRSTKLSPSVAKASHHSTQATSSGSLQAVFSGLAQTITYLTASGGETAEESPPNKSSNFKFETKEAKEKNNRQNSRKTEQRQPQSKNGRKKRFSALSKSRESSGAKGRIESSRSRWSRRGSRKRSSSVSSSASSSSSSSYSNSSYSSDSYSTSSEERNEQRDKGKEMDDESGMEVMPSGVRDFMEDIWF